MKRRVQKKRRVRLLIRAAAAVALLLALLALAAIWFDRPLLRRFVLPSVERAAGEALGLTFTIADADVDFPGGLTLRGILAEGPAPRTGIRRLSVEEAEVSFSLGKLLAGGGDWISKVRLVEPAIDLDLDHDPLLPSIESDRPRETGSPAPLPAIEIARGDFRIREKKRRLHLGGVDLSLVPPALSLSVREGDGAWTPPRIEALRFPVIIEARLAPHPEPFREITVERLSLGGREIAGEVKVDLSSPGIVSVAGSLPGWNVPRAAARIAGDVLDLTVEAERTDIRSIVALFTPWRCPAGLGTGSFRLVLPLHKEEDWRTETRMQVERVSWEPLRVEAELLVLEGKRGDDLILEGSALGLAMEFAGAPPMDLSTRFRREPADADGWRIVFRDLTLFHEDAVIHGAGSLLERGLRIEDTALVLEPSPLRAFRDVFSGLETSLERVPGAARCEIFCEGFAEEPASFEAALSAVVSGLRRAPESPPMEIEVDARLAACQVNVDEARWTQREDEVRASIAIGTGFPLRAAMTRLSGRFGEYPFEGEDLPVIDVDEGGFRLGSAVIQALGGNVAFGLEGSHAGDLDAWVSARGIGLEGLVRPLRVAGEPTGVISCDARLEVRTAPGGILPRLEADLRLTEGAWTIGRERVKDVGLRLGLRADEESIVLHEAVLTRGEDRASVAGRVPIRWTPRPELEPGGRSSGTFHAQVAEIAGLPIETVSFRDLGGRVVANGRWSAALGGRMADVLQSAEVEADVGVSAGVLKLFGDFPPLVGIEADIHARNREVIVTRLTGRIRDAAFDVEGVAAVNLPWDEAGASIASVDFRLVSKGALLLRRNDIRARGDVDLRWKGPWEATVLEGGAKVTRAYYVQDISLAPARRVRLPLQLFSIDAVPLRSMRFDLAVKADRTIIVSNNLASTRATADLRLTGTGLEPILTGTVSTDEGRVTFGNARLKIRNALIELVEVDPLNPRLNIILGETIRGYAVTVAITGTLGEPEVLLDSSPPLERERLLVLISTGMTFEEIEEQGMDRVAAVQAVLYLGRRIARYFSRGDPSEETVLDRFSIQSESARLRDDAYHEGETGRFTRYEDPVRVEFRVVEDFLLEDDEVFLQAERDTYGDYNLNAGIRFELE